MTTHFGWAATRLSVLAALLFMSVAVVAQSPIGTVKTPPGELQFPTSGGADNF